MTEHANQNEPTVAGLTKQYIDTILEKQGWLRFRIGGYDSDHPGGKERQAELFDDIGRLVTWLDLAETWPTQATAFSFGLEIPTTTDNGEPTYPTPAEALFDLTWWSLDIETEESGYADLTLTLEGDNARLQFIGSGDFWVDNRYTHRTTGHVLHGDELTDEQMTALNSHDDYIHDGEVACSLMFEVVVEQK